MEAFFAPLAATLWSRSFAYTHNQGKDYLETTPVQYTHLFNHKTHHRGEVQVMLSRTSVGLRHSTFTASSIP